MQSLALALTLTLTLTLSLNLTFNPLDEPLQPTTMLFSLMYLTYGSVTEYKYLIMVIKVT